MTSYIVGLTIDDKLRFYDELDMVHLTSKLNQQGFRYSIAFIIEEGKEDRVMDALKFLQSKKDNG